MDIDAKLDRVAARQYGVIRRDQALSSGMTERMIARRVEKGRWIRLAPGVYAFASAPPKWHRQVSAAVLSQPRALVAGRSAARLHGFPGYGIGRPELIVPASANARSPLARLIRDSHFDSIATTRIEGFSATTVAETIWTLAARIPRGELEHLVDDRLAARKLQVDEFDPILTRIYGERRPGGPALTAVLADRRLDAYQPATSELEAHLYPLLDHPEIPPYRRQCPIALDEGIEAVLDAFIDDWGLIVEADGRRWHTRQADFERDRRRDNAALAMGLIVVRFTYRMLVDEPDYCLRVLLKTGKSRERIRI